MNFQRVKSMAYPQSEVYGVNKFSSQHLRRDNTATYIMNKSLLSYIIHILL